MSDNKLYETPKPKIIENTAPNENDTEKNGQKRIQIAPIDGISKKPRINTSKDASAATENAEDKMAIIKEEAGSDMDQSSETKEYYVSVNNLPTDWTYMQIKNYLDQECGHVDEMEMLNHKKSKNCAIRLTFQSIDKCTEVYNKLVNKHLEDKKLEVEISTAYTTDVVPPDTAPNPMIMENSAKANEKNENGFENNDQEKMHIAPIDGTSKEPSIYTPEGSSVGTEKAKDENVLIKEEVMDEIVQSAETEEYYLTVHNLPTDWSYMQLKNYLDQECGQVDEMEMLKHRKSKNCAIRLTFQSIDKCTEVFNKLENKHLRDRKLEVKITDTYTTFSTDNSKNCIKSNEENGQKRIQTAPIDGTSKKPGINTPEGTSAETKKAEDEIVLIKEEGVQSSIAEEYYLTVHNLPTDWTYTQIKNYLDQECGHVDEMEMLKHRKSKNCTIRLTFQSIDKCTEVFNKLENKHLQDKKLKLKITDTYTTFPKDIKPLHIASKPKIIENITELNEKNGQKRIQTAPIDGTSKKPRINTPEDSSSQTKKAEDKSVIKNKGGEEDMDQSSETEEFYLTVHNLPTDWTYMQIKNYLDQECGHVDEMEMLKHKKSKNCSIRLTFQSIEKCTEVFKILENKNVEDKKLKVKISDTYTTFPMGDSVPSTMLESKHFTISNEAIDATRWRPDLDSWDTDPEGLYGLRLDFLKSLNIEPPINGLVHVTNFRCDKTELREVMELAGNVLMCSVVATAVKYAKVMYSHPLEAVQAISMLNGQLFYGTPLRISIDRSDAENVILPKGLASIGQGLGIKDRPIRNIVQQYHRYAKKQTSLINPSVFSEINFTNQNVSLKSEKNPKDKVQEFMTSRPGCNILNPTVIVEAKNVEDLECPDESENGVPGTSVVTKRRRPKKNSVGSQDPTKNGSQSQHSSPPQLAAPALGAAPPNPLVRQGFHPNIVLNPPVPMHNPLPMPGPRFRPQQEPQPFRPRVPFMGPPMQRPPFPQPRPPFGPPAGPQIMPMRPQIHAGMRPQMPQNFNAPRANLGNSVNVKFVNLPPSTTFPLLCDMLSQCGQVMSVQLTTPGCAVATFGHPTHAERCYQKFNKLNVDGFVIEVGFV